MEEVGTPERIAIVIASGGAAMTLFMSLVPRNVFSFILEVILIALFMIVLIYFIPISLSIRNKLILCGVVVVALTAFAWYQRPETITITPLQARYDEAYRHYKVPILVKAKNLKNASLVFDRFAKFPCDLGSVCDIGVERRIGWKNEKHSWDLTEINGQKEFIMFHFLSEAKPPRLVTFYEGIDAKQPEETRELKGLNEVPPGTYEVHLILRSDSDAASQDLCVYWDGRIDNLRIEPRPCK
jgi:hypothetical protein